MDAANLSLKRISLSVAFALLIPAAAYAQPAFSPSLTSIPLSNQPITETVNSSTGTPINFNATTSYQNGDPSWACLSQGSNSSLSGLSNLTTSTSFQVSVNCTGNQLSVFSQECAATVNPVCTHNATITLTPTVTDTSGAQPFSIPVTYTVSSGSGGGTSAVTANPASITENVGYGGSAQIYLSLTTASNTNINFSVGGTPSWITWYQYSGNTGFVSSAQSAVLLITMNGSGQNEASLTTTFVVNTASGTLNIPITLNNGVAGSGGSSGTGSLSVYPSTLSWSYSQSNTGLFPSSTTLSMSSTNGNIGFQATATSSNGWLLINNSTSFASGVVGETSLTLSPSENVAALASGTYTGTVVITGSDGSNATITVTLTVNGTGSTGLTISPSPISLNASVNGATAQTFVSITSAVSGTVSASISGSGLSVSGAGQNLNAGSTTTLTVFGNPGGLANGTYQGSLNVSVGGLSQQAQVNFVVGTGSGGSGGTNAAATPGQLTFYYEPNTNMPVTQSQQVWLSGSGNFTITSSTASSSPDWLLVSPSSGSLPTLLTVYAGAAGLASSTYNAQLTVNNTTTGQTTPIGVSFQINGISTVFASPGDYVFAYIAGVSSVNQTQQIDIETSDGAATQIGASVTNPSATPWLSVSGGGTSPVGLTAAVNASGLGNGVYSGSITISGGNNSLAVPIVLTVTGSSISTGTGPLTLGASSVSLQAPLNGSPVSQTVSVSSSNTTSFTTSAQGSYNGNTWLSVSPFGTTSAPSNITITASPAGLPAGTYTGTVGLASNGTNQTIQVTFVVGSTTSGGSNVVVTANGGSSTSPSLTFTATSLNETLSPQYISITSQAGQSQVTFTVSTSTSWIQLGTASGTTLTTPVTGLTVSANTSGLAGGTYNGTVTVTPSFGTAISVPVTLTIAGTPTVSVSSTSLSFSYSAGGAAPATQTVPVTVANGSSASFTATAASTPAGWLVVLPTSGTAPGSLSVFTNPAGLAGGTYSGTVTVAGTSGATGSTTINVTLTVTVPLPTITTVVNAASFVNEPISPGEIITIGGTNIGPATPLSFTLSGNLVPTTLGGVQVLISGHAAPLLYVSASQINCVVPYEIAGILNPTVLVEFSGASSNGYTVNAAATAPGIFTANGSGSGPGAILNSDSSVNTASNAAARGTVIQVYLTGEGQTQAPGVDGKVTTAPYPTPLVPIAITVGGVPANYQFAGEAPGLVSGVLQLNVIIPPAASLSATGAVPLSVSIGSASTQGGVTVNIK